MDRMPGFGPVDRGSNPRVPIFKDSHLTKTLIVFESPKNFLIKNFGNFNLLKNLKDFLWVYKIEVFESSRAHLFF